MTPAPTAGTLEVEIGEAARQLGMSTDALRKQLSRGQRPGRKGDDGRWVALLPRPVSPQAILAHGEGHSLAEQARLARKAAVVAAERAHQATADVMEAASLWRQFRTPAAQAVFLRAQTAERVALLDLAEARRQRDATSRALQTEHYDAEQAALAERDARKLARRAEAAATMPSRVYISGSPNVVTNSLQPFTIDNRPGWRGRLDPPARVSKT